MHPLILLLLTLVICILIGAIYCYFTNETNNTRNKKILIYILIIIAVIGSILFCSLGTEFSNTYIELFISLLVGFVISSILIFLITMDLYGIQSKEEFEKKTNKRLIILTFVIAFIFYYLIEKGIIH